MAVSNPAAVAETHISTVCFVGDRAFKFLRPIATPFLDYRSVDARRRAVARELELNRRLAPDVYLGTAEVTERDEVTDVALVMRRLPPERRLSRLVGGPGFPECVWAVVRRVAAFHAALPPDPEAAQVAGLDTVLARWEANLEEMRPWAGTVVPAELHDAVARLVRAYLARRAPLFEQRIARGFARDGHGDLLAEDIFCLDDGPRILDCLAFDDGIRKGDVLNDIAFLAMDLERLGSPGMAAQLLSWYSQLTDEHHPASLADHYVAYRAGVRAKIACLRHDQGADGADDEARDLLRLAHRHLAAAEVRMVAVGGPPGTGKSTTAAGLGDTMGWAVLSSDELRKDRAGIERTDHRERALDEGLYAPEVTGDVYVQLIERAAHLATMGESVVLDASWSDPDHRRALRAAAEASGARLVEIRCELDPAVAARRIAARAHVGLDPSDATPETAAELTARFAPWPEASPVDTSGSPHDALTAALTLARSPTEGVGMGQYEVENQGGTT